MLQKRLGVPVRIAHSHSTSNKKEWKKTLLKNILRPLSKKYANVYFACSELAGRWLFGNKTFDEGKVKIINNAINLEKFKYNEKIRLEKRRELCINEDALVIGHLGRFVAQKNHTFLIDIFKEIHKQKENSVLILAGQGPLEKHIEQKVKEMNLQDSIKFLGQRTDATELYQAFDMFVLPSLYEGLGLVLIEAQAAGLTCFASSKVPEVAKVSDNFYFIDLNSEPSEWSKNIINNYKKDNRKDAIKELAENNYDIKIEAEKLESIYIKLDKIITKKRENNDKCFIL